MLVAGPRHVSGGPDEHAAHYSQHRRNWHGTDLRPPNSDEIPMAAITGLAVARIRRQRVLGGLISEYQQQHDHRRPTVKPQLKGHDGVMETQD
jgi:hypothetical protein